MKEFITEKAIVRIHPGKLSEEERKKVLENAAKQFFRAIQIYSNTTDLDSIHSGK